MNTMQTHSESLLTMKTLTERQRSEGYYLKEDEDFIFICKAGEKLINFTLFATSDVIRTEVDRLIKEIKP